MCNDATNFTFKLRTIDDIKGISSKLDIFDQFEAIAGKLWIEHTHDCHELHEWCTWELARKSLEDLAKNRGACIKIWEELRGDDRIKIIGDALGDAEKLAFWLGILEDTL